jgi:inhibitor of cysteine peptidase
MAVQTSLKAGTRRADAAVFAVIVLMVSAVVAIFSISPGGTAPLGGSSSTPVSQGLASFQNDSQLLKYITANAKSAQQYNRNGVLFGGKMGMVFGGAPVALQGGFNALATGAVASTATASSTPSFTGTNVQVQGVDEPDKVKTDGTHLFVSTGDAVNIINAYPPNSSSVLSTVTIPTASVLGLEIGQDRLMVIDQSNTNTQYIGLQLYDTSTISAPKLIQNVSIEGTFVAARLAQGYLYAVIQQPSYTFSQGNATAAMPYAVENGAATQIPPSSVYYTPNRAQISYYTMISSISMATGKETILSVLTGPSATVYVSTSNIYVVYTNYLDIFDADGIPGDVYTGGVISAAQVQQAQNSTIMRASYSSGTVKAEAAGVVPGTVLNQFSLDEYSGYFRLATGRFATVGGTSTRSDDVYVLNMNLTQVSALRNIAPGENIYAVRFVGAMGYVVTFEQIDPLFVISFKDMTNPTILSALKVNGYSDYLHPLPGGYLLGIGKDAVPSSTGNFAWYLGLKLSLFRVFDNGTSVQVSKLLIGDRGTDSPVLSDHLAFTFDSTRNITVIPVTLAVVSGNYPSGPNSPPPYGDVVWQGVYLIKVTSIGFTTLGRVSQYPPGQGFGDSPNNNLQIDRSVIIGDYLYTISQSEVMVSSLSSSSFTTVATVQLR